MSLTFWASRSVGLSWWRVFPLAIGSHLMWFWCRQYYAFLQPHPLMVSNPKFTTSEHWGITDGIRWRDLVRHPHTPNEVVIRPPKPLPQGSRPNLFYIPFCDFGVLGEGNLDDHFVVPKHYDHMRNTCQTYALDLAQASGYSIFKCPEAYVWASCFLAFMATHFLFEFPPEEVFELLYSIDSRLYYLVVAPLHRLYSFKRFDQLDVSEYSDKIVREALEEYFRSRRTY